MGVKSEDMFFQQTGAYTHMSSAVLDASSEYFGDGVVLNHFPECFGCGVGNHVLQISSPVVTFYGGI
jgi:hypothetical protein